MNLTTLATTVGRTARTGLSALLITGLTEIGIGVVSAAGRIWVAQVFRQPSTPTTTRVRTYQRHHGLHPTGTVGRATWNRLF